MKKIVRLPIITALAAVLALPACTKEEGVAPKTEQSKSDSADLNIFDNRTTEVYFPGKSNPNFNITGFDAEYADVLMIRTNYIEAANGNKVITTWQGKTRLNPADYPTINFPYTFKSSYIDQHESLLGRPFYTIFNIDVDGNTTLKLTWSGL